MPGKSFARQIDEWRFLIEQSRPLLTEAPHLAVEHAAFEGIVQEVEGLRARAVMAFTVRKEANSERRAAELRAVAMRDRFAGALAYQFGAKSEKLRDFGLNPKGRRRKPVKEEPAPGPGQPAAAQTGTPPAAADPPTHPTT